MKKIFRITLTCLFLTIATFYSFSDVPPEVVEKQPIPIPCVDKYGSFTQYGSECNDTGLACIDNPCPIIGGPEDE